MGYRAVLLIGLADRKVMVADTGNLRKVRDHKRLSRLSKGAEFAADGSRDAPGDARIDFVKYNRRDGVTLGYNFLQHKHHP